VVTTEDEIQGVYDARHRPSLLIGAATELLSGPSSSLTVQMNCQFGFVRKHFILPPSCMCLSSCCLSGRGSCQTCDKPAGVSLLAFHLLGPFPIGTRQSSRNLQNNSRVGLWRRWELHRAGRDFSDLECQRVVQCAEHLVLHRRKLCPLLDQIFRLYARDLPVVKCRRNRFQFRAESLRSKGHFASILFEHLSGAARNLRCDRNNACHRVIRVTVAVNPFWQRRCDCFGTGTGRCTGRECCRRQQK